MKRQRESYQRFSKFLRRTDRRIYTVEFMEMKSKKTLMYCENCNKPIRLTDKLTGLETEFMARNSIFYDYLSGKISLRKLIEIISEVVKKLLEGR